MSTLPPLPLRPAKASPTPPPASGATGWRSPPSPAAECHPMRCPATLDGGMSYVYGYAVKHIHLCIHPARVREGVVGVPVHECECGASWRGMPTEGETR